MNRYELEWRMVYAPLVAGKSAHFADMKTSALLARRPGLSPLEALRAMITDGELAACLRASRTGSYGRLERCFTQLVELDPGSCSIEDLEAVHGIGPKTARFFVLWTRPGARVAALDVHILRWLASEGYDVPKATPPAGPRYAEIERWFLDEADDRNVTPRELDLEIWAMYSGHVEQEQAEQLELVE